MTSTLLVAYNPQDVVVDVVYNTDQSPGVFNRGSTSTLTSISDHCKGAAPAPAPAQPAAAPAATATP